MTLLDREIKQAEADGFIDYAMRIGDGILEVREFIMSRIDTADISELCFYEYVTEGLNYIEKDEETLDVIEFALFCLWID